MKVDATQLLGAQNLQRPSLSATGKAGLGAASGAAVTGAAAPTRGAFASGVRQAVGSLVEAGRAADASTVQIVTGNPGDLHEAMLLTEQAEIGMRFVVQLRNRAIAAYEEVMRMQV